MIEFKLQDRQTYIKLSLLVPSYLGDYVSQDEIFTIDLDCKQAHELRRKLIDLSYELSNFIDRSCDET